MIVSYSCIHFLEMEEARNHLDHVRASAGIATYSVDGAAILTDRDLLAAVALEPQFPDWFGMNWDALDDCIVDMDGLDAPGYVLTVWNSIDLWRDAPRTAGHLIRAWLRAAEETWVPRGKPFHLVFAW